MQLDCDTVNKFSLALAVIAVVETGGACLFQFGANETHRNTGIFFMALGLFILGVSILQISQMEVRCLWARFFNEDRSAVRINIDMTPIPTSPTYTSYAINSYAINSYTMP